MSPRPATAVLPTNLAGKYLAFLLENEEYGIGILKVQEIIGMMPVTVVPRMPEWIRGVINLRGKIIPVIDLRIKFGMPSIPTTSETCIIFVRNAEMDVGLIVDRVLEVLNVFEQDVDVAPNLGADVNTDYFLGICKSNGHVRLLLDIAKVLASSELEGSSDSGSFPV